MAINRNTFQALSDSKVLVLGSDRKLWLEHGPFGAAVPPRREQVDGNVQAFQALSGSEAFVLGTDHKFPGPVSYYSTVASTNGVPPRDVAKNLGVSIPTLYRWIPASTHA